MDEKAVERGAGAEDLKVQNAGRGMNVKEWPDGPGWCNETDYMVIPVEIA